MNKTLKYSHFRNNCWYFHIKEKEHKVSYQVKHQQIQFCLNNEHFSIYLDIESNKLLQQYIKWTFMDYLFMEKLYDHKLSFNLDILDDIDFLGKVVKNES